MQKKQKVKTEQQLLNEKEIKEKFEAHFGKDSKSRTRNQWKKLVHAYGIKTVCLTEGLTEAEVKAKMNETFSQRLKKQYVQNRLQQAIQK